MPPPQSPDEWMWLLTADTAPQPDALSTLLAAVEVAPSVAIAGPKIVHPDDPADLESFGVSVSGFGRTVPLVDGGLDQGQYDREDDVLGVSVSGALVRRSVWTESADSTKACRRPTAASISRSARGSPGIG